MANYLYGLLQVVRLNHHQSWCVWLTYYVCYHWGNPRRFARNIEIYKSIALSYGHDPSKLPIGVHSWGYVAETDEQAKREFFPSLKAHQDIIGKEKRLASFR